MVSASMVISMAPYCQAERGLLMYMSHGNYYYARYSDEETEASGGLSYLSKVMQIVNSRAWI